MSQFDTDFHTASNDFKEIFGREYISYIDASGTETEIDPTNVLSFHEDEASREETELGLRWVRNAVVILASEENLFTRSEELDNSDWTKVGLDVTANDDTTEPSGSKAEKLTEDTSNGEHKITQDITFVSGDQYEVSFLVKLDTQPNMVVAIEGGVSETTKLRIRLSTGFVFENSNLDDFSLIDLGDSWKFLSVRFTPDVVATSTVRIGFIDLNWLETYVGGGSNSLWLTKVQARGTDRPTTYVRTESDAVSNIAPKHDGQIKVEQRQETWDITSIEQLPSGVLIRLIRPEIIDLAKPGYRMGSS